MPFRSARQQNVVEKPETGAVAEMVRQFADPYAFVRELVQNSIDAGASSLTVRVERAAGIVTTAFQDDGSGMDRATIDGPLLTLFNSSKEGDSSKIGKYGVGFVSVFAIDPELVDVDTWRDEQHHRVRLFLDYRYELEILEKRPDSGTIVTLHKPMDATTFDEHRRRLETALCRWCRFAIIPIELVCVDHDRSEEISRRRIDNPLSVPSALYVHAHRGSEHIVIGPSVGAERYVATLPASDDPATSKVTFAGFYNRGLTLFETEIPLNPTLCNVRLRIDSPALRHTLSRDNVLRDRAFAKVVDQAKEIVETSLRRELLSRLTRAARDLAKAKPPYDEQVVLSYLAFLEAATVHPFQLPLKQIPVPLAHPFDDKPCASLDEILSRKMIFCVSAPDELSRAVSIVHQPVFLAPNSAIANVVNRHAPVPGPINPENLFVLVHEVIGKDISDTDKAFCEAVHKALVAIGIRVRRVAIGRTRAKMDTPCILIQGPVRRVHEHEWLSPKDFAQFAWSDKKPSGTLLLLESNEAVQLARQRATQDLFLAAHVFTRTLLLRRLDSDGKLSDDLLESAAKEIA